MKARRIGRRRRLLIGVGVSLLVCCVVGLVLAERERRVRASIAAAEAVGVHAERAVVRWPAFLPLWLWRRLPQVPANAIVELKIGKHNAGDAVDEICQLPPVRSMDLSRAKLSGEDLIRILRSHPGVTGSLDLTGCEVTAEVLDEVVRVGPSQFHWSPPRDEAAILAISERHAYLVTPQLTELVVARFLGSGRWAPAADECVAFEFADGKVVPAMDVGDEHRGRPARGERRADYRTDWVSDDWREPVPVDLRLAFSPFGDEKVTQLDERTVALLKLIRKFRSLELVNVEADQRRLRGDGAAATDALP